MFAIWRLVREEKDLRGARSVVQACQRIISRGAIKFLDDGVLYDRVASESATSKTRIGELLRQRYQAADSARADKDRFPILAARTVAYLADLKKARESQEKLTSSYVAMREDGHSMDGSTLPQDKKRQLALNNEYAPSSKEKRRPKPLIVRESWE